MLEAIDIHKSYGQLEVLKGVSLRIKPGEVVALVGSSGAGKSTLLQIMGTLDSADSGKILFEGKDLSQWSERQQARFRNESLGFVFQFHHLLPEFTALENAAMPAFIAGKPRSEALERAQELLGMLGLENRGHHKPGELSGGEQQRVAMARAMVNQPKIILADEPTGNLDSANSHELHRIMNDLARKTGIGFLIATHNLQLTEQCDRVLTIRDGLIQGPQEKSPTTG